MATASISFSTSGSAPNGYRIRYRKLGDTGSYTTTTSATSPVTINSFSGVGIEGLIDADCGSGNYSSAQSFSAPSLLACSSSLADIYTGSLYYNYNNYKFRLDLSSYTPGDTARVTFNVNSLYASGTLTRPARWTLFRNGNQVASQSYVGVMTGISGSWGSTLSNPGPKYHTLSGSAFGSTTPTVVTLTSASSSGTTVTVASTASLSGGMTVVKQSGTGEFAPDTRIVEGTITSTTFQVNKTIVTPFSGGATIRASDTFEYLVEVAETVSTNQSNCSWSLDLNCNYTPPGGNCTNTALTSTTYRGLIRCGSGGSPVYYTISSIFQSGQLVQGGVFYYNYNPTYNITYTSRQITLASSSGNTVTVCDTTGLTVGMVITKSSGTGTLQSNTVITAVNSTTAFTVDKVPTLALSGATIVGTMPDPANNIGTVTVVTNNGQPVFNCP